MCTAHRLKVLERDFSSSTLHPRLNAQAGDQVKDNEHQRKII